MLKSTNRMPALAWVGVAATLCLIGWVAKTTFAQNTPQKAATNAAAAEPAAPPSLPEDLNVPTIKAEPANSYQANPPLAVDTRPGPIASPPEPNHVSPRSSLEEVPATADSSAGSSSAASTSADPEKAALVFVLENQKLAESQLKNLKDEESKLKARLLKVQAGIQRWESLVEALKQSQGSVAVVIPGGIPNRIVTGPEPGPEHLEPVDRVPNSRIVPK
jgi:hypothetical protein